jgi:hypothetical protein
MYTNLSFLAADNRNVEEGPNLRATIGKVCPPLNFRRDFFDELSHSLMAEVAEANMAES